MSNKIQCGWHKGGRNGFSPLVLAPAGRPTVSSFHWSYVALSNFDCDDSSEYPIAFHHICILFKSLFFWWLMNSLHPEMKSFFLRSLCRNVYQRSRRNARDKNNGKQVKHTLKIKLGNDVASGWKPYLWMVMLLGAHGNFFSWRH